MICCIASKGRPNTKTHKIFEEANIKTFHFVEPQELDSYNSIPNIVDIERNDSGLAYVRNFIMEWSVANGHEWIIMCDDDVTKFGFYDVKNHKVGAEIWHGILEKIKGFKFEIAGINFRQHAWHEKKKISINTKSADVCVLLNIRALKWRFDESFKMKADRDFLLQTIKNGYGVIKFNKYFHESPDVGTNNGGLNNDYASERDTESALMFVKKWHPYAKLTKRGGRVDAKINYKGFAKAHGKVVR